MVSHVQSEVNYCMSLTQRLWGFTKVIHPLNHCDKRGFQSTALGEETNRTKSRPYRAGNKERCKTEECGGRQQVLGECLLSATHMRLPTKSCPPEPPPEVTSGLEETGLKATEDFKGRFRRSDRLVRDRWAFSS